MYLSTGVFAIDSGPSAAVLYIPRGEIGREKNDFMCVKTNWKKRADIDKERN